MAVEDTCDIRLPAIQPDAYEAHGESAARGVAEEPDGGGRDVRMLLPADHRDSARHAPEDPQMETMAAVALEHGSVPRAAATVSFWFLVRDARL